MKSIQRQLSLGLGAVLLVVWVLLAQTSVWLLDLGVRRYLESSLQVESESLLAALVRGPDGVQLDERRLNPMYFRAFSGRYFRVEWEQGTLWRSRSLWDSELQDAPSSGLQTGLRQGPVEQELLVYSTTYKRYGQTVKILVAQDYTPVLRSLQEVRYLLLVIGIATLLLLLGLQRWIVHRALRPVEQARRQVAQLQQGARSQLDTDVPAELEPLVAQINHLLRHTEDNLRRSRNAIGNLGHALKTPLAVLVSLVERGTLDDRPELRATLHEQLRQIEQRIGRELGRARLAGDVLPGAYFDCDRELEGLFSSLRQMHGEHLDLHWQVAAGLRLPLDREDVLEILGNLLDNACKWADREVRLLIRMQAQGGYELLVDDDGPGIDPERREQVLLRGTRLDEQVAGHGLGLGIVKDLVDGLGGILTLGSSELGGLRVHIQLPVQSSSL